MAKKKPLQKNKKVQKRKVINQNMEKEVKKNNIKNDIKSKTIFQNPVLCSQFLRNYVDHPMMKNIQPSDIEDCTDRYLSYFGVEFEADTVKKIHIRDTKAKINEFYLISLIEHKSKVDYNVPVQLLKYMTCIWAEYEKQFGTDYKNQVKTKEFRYPPILPVVYHEGNDTWTAPFHLGERIFMHEIFEEYIPDFTYFLVNNQDFSKEELLEHQDEMSLIMLINKIQNKADLSEFLQIPPEDINRIVRESPEAVIDIVVMVMQALCTKLNLPKQDAEVCVEKVRTRDMGYLWENMEKIDVQAAQAEVAAAKKELQSTRAQLEDTKKALDGAKVELDGTKAELNGTKAELDGTKAELDGTKAELHDAKEKSLASDARIAYLEALVAKQDLMLQKYKIDTDN